MQLGDGVYSSTAALHEGPTHTTVCYDWIEHAASFQVLPTPTDPFTGVCRLEMDIRHRVDSADPEEMKQAQSIHKA